MEHTRAPTEIEVTPDMIEAGAAVLSRYSLDLGPTFEEMLAERIIRCALEVYVRGRQQAPK